MELNGEEKRIQALFHELQSHDDRIAPSFARTWNIAQSRLGRSQSVKSLLPVPALISAALLICVLGAAIVLWSVNLRPPDQQAQTNLSEQFRNDADDVFKMNAEPKSNEPNSEKPKTKAKNNSVRPRTRVGKRTMTSASVRKIKSSDFSRWQSPTVGLLRFPGDELLKNNPVLNQSAHEMRGFLSN